MASTRSQQFLEVEDTPEDVAVEEPNGMKRDLENGALTTRSRYRDFTNFLDLKKEFHNEFVNRLWRNAQNDYAWEDLDRDESMREQCVSNFLKDWGKHYWGAEENRRKYYLPESFNDPENLCIWPERKQEITTTLMILLRKKAEAKTQEKSFMATPGLTPHVKATSKRNITQFNDSSSYSDGTPSDSRQKTDRKDKRRASESYGLQSNSTEATSTIKIERSNGQRAIPSANKIRPFSSITDHTGRFTPKLNDDSTPTTRQTRRTLNSMLEKPAQFDPSPVVNIKPKTRTFGDSTDASNKYLARKYGSETKILVAIFGQQGIAPIHVAYRDFGSSSFFIELMVAETGLLRWSPSVQLNEEITQTLLGSPSSTPSNSVVASIKFEWSQFWIRVRPGHDQDWEYVMQELYKSWSIKEQSDDANFMADGFRLHVTLHVLP